MSINELCGWCLISPFSILFFTFLMSTYGFKNSNLEKEIIVKISLDDSILMHISLFAIRMAFIYWRVG